MGEQKPSIAGDPKEPIQYLKEFLRGEISYNPSALSEAYMNLAEKSDGTAALAYSALAWAVNAQSLGVNNQARQIKELEQRIKALEQRLGK